MAPKPNKGNQVVGSCKKSRYEHRGTKDGVERTISDTKTLEVIKKQGIGMEEEEGAAGASIINRDRSEECQVSEECSEEYIKEVTHWFWGKFICGLCGEAVMLKNGGTGRSHECMRHQPDLHHQPRLFRSRSSIPAITRASINNLVS